MKTKEKIKVFANIRDGEVVCICKRTRKKCNCKTCEPEVVVRDKCYGWRETMYRNKYGK